MSDELKKIRKKIDLLDRQLISKLNERANLAKIVKKAKDNAGDKEIFKPSREASILKSIDKLNIGPLTTDHLQSIYREIMSACLSLETDLKVACLGPEMSYSHSALLKFFGTSTLVSFSSNINDVFKQVDNDSVDYGIVPLENSSQGSVKQTIDNLVSTNLNINGEINIAIKHCLLSLTKNIKAIKKVYAHEQSFQQCDLWISKKMPNIKRISVDSNSAAVKNINKTKNVAAIASASCAAYYNLPIIEKNINDSSQNSTRFIVISKTQTDISGDDKTSLLVSLKNKAGSLSKIIDPLSKNRISMSKIESIPTKKNNWEYMFLIDIDGHASNPIISKTLSQIEARSQFFKKLGSYPKSI